MRNDDSRANLGSGAGRQPFLKIVPYSPSDYSLGEALNKADGTKISDASGVSSALSLYFQWEGYRKALFYSENIKGIKCSFDYDRDERSPTELYLYLDDAEYVSKVRDFQDVVVRFEVFRVCYEFNSKVISVSQGEGDSPSFLVLSIPADVLVYKARRLPRVVLKDGDSDRLGKVTWKPKEGVEQEISIVEFGMGSVLFRSDAELAGSGEISIGSDSFSANLVRNMDSLYVAHLLYSSGKDVGRYFDHYRVIAFPNLVPKTPSLFNACVELYKDSGYFGKFLSDQEFEKHCCELRETWKSIFTGQHVSTADYLTMSDDGRMLGSSSAVVAFQQLGVNVWTFHQLCALTESKYIQATKQLYNWRAEYLSARPEPLVGSVFFHSKSRWLERIYVKFSAFSQGKTRLFPVFISKHNFVPGESNYQISSFYIGEARRDYLVGAAGLMGSRGPRLLNASGLLDILVLPENEFDAEQAKSVGTAMATHAKEEIELYIAAKNDIRCDTLPGGVFENTDRFCTFPKEELVSFATSVDHVLAVTERKLANG